MKSYAPSVDIPTYKYEEYLKKIVDRNSLDRNGNKFTFRCPLCGDSSSNQFKKRGFLLTNSDGNATMGCHNCGHKESFNKTLRENFPSIYKDWIMDVYFGDRVESLQIRNVEVKEVAVDYTKFLPVKIKTANVRDEIVRRQAVEFIKNRRIPKSIAKEFKYCSEYFENKFINRVIIPHYMKDGTYSYFEARDLTGKSFLRYKYPPGLKQEYYNLNFIDKTRDFFIFEGTIDSFFVNNSFACGGATKLKTALSMIDKRFHKNAILVFDGDKDGIRIAHQMLKKGYRVFVWNYDMFQHSKDNKIDINMLVMSGYFDNDIVDDGFIRTEKIMKHVVTPTIHNVLAFEIDYQMLGFTMEDMNDRTFQKRR